MKVEVAVLGFTSTEIVRLIRTESPGQKACVLMSLTVSVDLKQH